MSTVTDPYQPLESRHQITRHLLEIMLGEDYNPRPTLVIQTRSPIITRDIDYLQRFKNLRINMSIPTGSEAVRKDFEALSPSINARLNALKKIKRETQDLSKGFRPKLSITITPLLPTFPEDIDFFIDQLKFVDRIVIQDFHMNSKSSLIASTREEAAKIKEKYNWWYQSGVARYQDFKQKLIIRLPNVEVMEGKAGFGYE
jgi:DNA repair photolyase